MVGFHVHETFTLLPCPRADVVEGDWGDIQVLEPDGGGQLRERVDKVVVDPPVAPVAVPGAHLVAEHAALEVEPCTVADDPRCSFEVLGREPVGPERRRLDDMVVDGNDAGDFAQRRGFVGEGH